MDLPQPPADQELKNIIDKLAQFVARNGPEFEHMTKQKQKDNPKFSFLFGGNYFHYYQYRVTTEQAILKQKQRSLEAQQAIVQQAMNRQSIQSAPWQQPQMLPPAAHEQIRQSEQNLAAQHQLLLQQQQIQVDDAIRKAQEEKLMKLSQDCELDLKQLDGVLQPIVDSCTKDSISTGKVWIFSHATNHMRGEVIVLYILKRVMEPGATFETKLHLVYLINDVLHHCIRKNAEELKNILERVVVPVFCSTSIGVDAEKQQKLNKLHKLWETNNYFPKAILDQMQNPATSLAAYQTSLIGEYAALIAPITAGVQTQYSLLQKQHQDFVAHLAGQVHHMPFAFPPNMLPPFPAPLVEPPLLHQPPPQDPRLQRDLLPPTAPFDMPVVEEIPKPPCEPEEPPLQEPLPPVQNEPPEEPPEIKEMEDIKPPIQDNVPPEFGGEEGDEPRFGDPRRLNGRPRFMDDFSPRYGPPPNYMMEPPEYGMTPPHSYNHPPHFHEMGLSPRHMAMPPDYAEPPPCVPPYYDLPAGLMVPLVRLEDTDYEKPLDPEDVCLPPPALPTERLLAAVEQFYCPPTHERTRNNSYVISSEGWEQLGLYEFFKAKAQAKKQKGLPEGRDYSLSMDLPPMPGYLDKKRRRYQEVKSSEGEQVLPPKNVNRSKRHSRSRSRSPDSTCLPSRSPSPPSHRAHFQRSRARSRSPPEKRRSPERSPSPPSFVAGGRAYDRRLDESNKGHQLLKKMGWSGAGGLGATEQGIQDPVDAGDVRDRQDMYKGIGSNLNDPYENFRKSKGQAFINRMKARAEELGKI